MTAETYAAFLRVLRNVSGMLMHNDAHLVFDQTPDLESVMEATVDTILKITPVTHDDMIDYGLTRRDHFEVVKGDDGIWRFQLKDGAPP